MSIPNPSHRRGSGLQSGARTICMDAVFKAMFIMMILNWVVTDAQSEAIPIVSSPGGEEAFNVSFICCKNFTKGAGESEPIWQWDLRTPLAEDTMVDGQCGAGRQVDIEYEKCDELWLEDSLRNVISMQPVEGQLPGIEPPAKSVDTKGQEASTHVVQLHFATNYEDTVQILQGKGWDTTGFCARAFDWFLGHMPEFNMYNQTMHLQEGAPGLTMVVGHVELTRTALENAEHALKIYGNRPLRFIGHSQFEWPLSSWMIMPAPSHGEREREREQSFIVTQDGQAYHVENDKPYLSENLLSDVDSRRSLVADDVTPWWTEGTQHDQYNPQLSYMWGWYRSKTAKGDWTEVKAEARESVFANDKPIPQKYLDSQILFEIWETDASGKRPGGEQKKGSFKIFKNGQFFDNWHKDRKDYEPNALFDWWTDSAGTILGTGDAHFKTTKSELDRLYKTKTARHFDK